MGPAVLVVGGTYDAEDCYGAWNLYRALAAQSPATPLHLVVGPWSHGAWRSEGRRLGSFDFGAEASGAYYMEHFELPFFDHYLRGEGDADPLPAVAVFSSGDNRWHSFGGWTPRESEPLTLYLQEGGALTAEPPTAAESATSYLSDPSDPVPYLETFTTRRPKEYMVADQRFLAGRDDIATFVSAPLTEPLTLVGPVEVLLCASLSTTDADFVVKLIDLYPADAPESTAGEPVESAAADRTPGGFQMLVRGEVMRGRYRKGFSRPEAFTPGEPEQIRFRTTDIAHTFLPGHRIMIQVQSSWFPLMERHPQQYVDLWHCTEADFVPCRVTLYHDRVRSSFVTVHRL